MSVTFTAAEMALLRNLLDASALDGLIHTLRKEADQKWAGGKKNEAVTLNMRASAYVEIQRKLYAPLSVRGPT